MPHEEIPAEQGLPPTAEDLLGEAAATLTYVREFATQIRNAANPMMPAPLAVVLGFMTSYAEQCTHLASVLINDLGDERLYAEAYESAMSQKRDIPVTRPSHLPNGGLITPNMPINPDNFRGRG